MHTLRRALALAVTVPLSITATPATAPAAFPAPKNGKIVYHASDDDGFWNHIWVVKKNGSNRTNLTKDSPTLNRDPRWSPNGKRIAFASTRGGAHYDVYTMKANGENVRRLTSDPALDAAPAWSPDGKKIVFHSVRDRQCTNIYKKFLKTGRVVALTTGCGDNIYPVWSPTGERIVFTSQRGPFEDVVSYDIWSMKPGGFQLRRLTDGETNEYACDWSPDGEWVLFIRFHPPPPGQRDWQFDLYKIRSDGTGETRLTTDGVNGTCSHVWSPNGKRILFRGEKLQTMNPNGGHVKTLPIERFGESMDWQPRH